MKPMECSVAIAAHPGIVWRAVSNIEHAARWIPAIKSIEILDGPRTGKGLRWRETRIMFGREATEVMEIAEWKPPFSRDGGGMYVATATNHGTAYRSDVRVEPSGSGTRLRAGPRETLRAGREARGRRAATARETTGRSCFLPLALVGGDALAVRLDRLEVGL